MKQFFISALLLAGAAHAAEPPPLPCAPPEIPEVSTSNDSVRLVEQRLAAWKKCAEDYQVANPTDASLAQVQSAYDDIIERRNRWVAATNRYNSEQMAGRTRPTLGANGLAAAWETRNVHDMSPRTKPRTKDSDAAEAKQ